MTMRHSDRQSRNSSIELLRLVSMLMIVGFHYVWCSNLDQSWLTTQDISLKKIVYEFIYGGGGWVGNFIFFAISVWFLADRTTSLRSDLRRVWIMERELLFWGILLFVVCVLLRQNGYYVGTSGDAAMLVKSVFPLSMELWWYPTSYAIFLLLFPFLNKGMRSLGKDLHRNLSIICLIIWGFFGMIPKVRFDLIQQGVFVFIYWYILLTYYKWYMRKLSKRGAWYLLGAGIAVELIFIIAANIFYQLTDKMAKMQFFMFTRWRLPAMMIGFAVFVLVSNVEFHSKVVNVIAASSFGVYLIHYNPYIFSFWTHYVPAERVYVSKHALALGLMVIVTVFVLCLVLDLMRQGLFKLTIDRNRGAWFDKLYAWALLKTQGQLVKWPSRRRAMSPGSTEDDSDLVD